jgi:hypothetical protein
MIHAAHRIIQVDVPGPSAKFGWDIARVNAKHGNILLCLLELDCD